MISHRVPSPLIFGIRDGAGLGNNAEELESSSLLMNKMVIMPMQNIILQTLGQIFHINGWDTEAKIETLQPIQWLEGGEKDAEATTEDEKQVEGQPLVETTNEPVAVEEDIQKTALNGAQIKSLLEIITQISAGALQKASAKSIIKAAFPTFTDLQVGSIVDNIEINPQEFSKEGEYNVIPEKFIKPVLKHMAESGEKQVDLEKEGWVLMLDDDFLTKEGVMHKLNPVKFAIASNPEQKSELDRALYKIRYEYRGPRDDKNRDFCASVLDMNLIYRKEDIDGMSDSATNPEFGDYSIWDYKGSYGCRHKWHRLVFFRKRNSQGRFMPNDGLENERTVSVSNTPSAVIPEDTKATTLNKNL